MPEITKTSSDTVEIHDWFWIVFIVLTVFVYLFGLTIPLVGPDEPRYAQVAREMFERGDLVTPTLGGFNWFEKPALLYWLQIAAYHVFGVNEFAARFGSALSGLGTVSSLWFIGRFSPVKHDDRIRFAKWLALISASTLGIIVFSRGASFDIIVTFPITAALACFCIYESRTMLSSSGPTWLLVLFFIFTGIAVLAKGLIGFIFPLGIVGLYYFVSWRSPKGAVLLSLTWGVPLAAAVASIWYLPMYIEHGPRFVNEFFIQQHFQRFTSNKYQHPQPFYFFFWVLPLMTIPWLPFFVAAIWQRLSRLRRSLIREPVDTESKVGTFTPSFLPRFAIAWLLVPLLFFSFSGSKLPGYILPAVPAAILLTVTYIYDRLLLSRTWAAAIQGIAVATYVVIIVLLIFVVPEFARKESVKSLIESANSRGYESAPVASYLAVSHNAEFYAAGRVVRDQFGKQRRFVGPPELIEYVREYGAGPIIVLVPFEHERHLLSIPELNVKPLADNRDRIIAAVTAK